MSGSTATRGLPFFTLEGTLRTSWDKTQSLAPFHIDPTSTFVVTVDGGRHLVLGDSNTETLIFVGDIQKHPIETFSFIGFTTSQHGMESAIRQNGMHMGDISYRQIEQLGLGSESFWSLGMQAEADYILSREAELFEPSSENNPVVTPTPEPNPTTESVASNVALVDADWYLSQNPDIAAAGVDPTAHYMQWGWQEGRDPNSLFDTSYYLDAHADVALAGVDPLEHYLNWGILEGREIAAVV